MPQLSAIVITRNEAANIGECLDSLAFCDERIVVDCGSTDSTVDIAREKGARVEFHEWRGFGPQKSHALALATGTWVLSIDADERVTPELAAAIRAAIAGGDDYLGACRRIAVHARKRVLEPRHRMVDERRPQPLDHTGADHALVDDGVIEAGLAAAEQPQHVIGIPAGMAHRPAAEAGEPRKLPGIGVARGDRRSDRSRKLGRDAFVGIDRQHPCAGRE